MIVDSASSSEHPLECDRSAGPPDQRHVPADGERICNGNGISIRSCISSGLPRERTGTVRESSSAGGGSGSSGRERHGTAAARVARGRLAIPDAERSAPQAVRVPELRAPELRVRLYLRLGLRLCALLVPDGTSFHWRRRSAGAGAGTRREHCRRHCRRHCDCALDLRHVAHCAHYHRHHQQFQHVRICNCSIY